MDDNNNKKEEFRYNKALFRESTMVRIKMLGWRSKFVPAIVLAERLDPKEYMERLNEEELPW